MTDLREAAQMALDALDSDNPDIQLRAAIHLRAALAQPEQEPVAWIEEAKAIAAQCWCDSETSHIVMEPVLAEAVARRIAAWMETGSLHARNEAYWRDRALKAEEAAPPQREWCQCKDAPNDCTYENNCRVPQIDAAFKRIEWQGLTDEEMHECAGEYPWTPTGLKCCRAIEAKLKEKNS